MNQSNHSNHASFWVSINHSSPIPPNMRISQTEGARRTIVTSSVLARQAWRRVAAAPAALSLAVAVRATTAALLVFWRGGRFGEDWGWVVVDPGLFETVRDTHRINILSSAHELLRESAGAEGRTYGTTKLGLTNLNPFSRSSSIVLPLLNCPFLGCRPGPPNSSSSTTLGLGVVSSSSPARRILRSAI